MRSLGQSADFHFFGSATCPDITPLTVSRLHASLLSGSKLNLHPSHSGVLFYRTFLYLTPFTAALILTGLPVELDLKDKLLNGN